MSSLQCAALTSKGVECKRNAQAGSKFCWQHQNYKQSLEQIEKSIQDLKLEEKDLELDDEWNQIETISITEKFLKIQLIKN